MLMRPTSERLEAMLLALVLQSGVAPVLLALAHVAAGKGAITSGILSEAAGIDFVGASHGCAPEIG